MNYVNKIEAGIISIAALVAGAWISPTAQFFDITGGTHLQWLRANDPLHLYSSELLEIMKQQFAENQRLKNSTQKQEDDIFYEYLKQGWTRIFITPPLLHLHLFKFNSEQVKNALNCVYDNRDSWNMLNRLEIIDEGTYFEEIRNLEDEEGYEMGLADSFKNSTRHPVRAKTDFRKKILAEQFIRTAASRPYDPDIQGDIKGWNLYDREWVFTKLDTPDAKNATWRLKPKEESLVGKVSELMEKDGTYYAVVNGTPYNISEDVSFGIPGEKEIHKIKKAPPMPEDDEEEDLPVLVYGSIKLSIREA